MFWKVLRWGRKLRRRVFCFANNSTLSPPSFLLAVSLQFTNLIISCWSWRPSVPDRRPAAICLRLRELKTFDDVCGRHMSAAKRAEDIWWCLPKTLQDCCNQWGWRSCLSAAVNRTEGFVLVNAWMHSPSLTPHRQQVPHWSQSPMYIEI